MWVARSHSLSFIGRIAPLQNALGLDLSLVRIIGSLALLYMLRMLGLFMVLPVLALYGSQYSGASLTSLGLALGIYGLSQALLQIPLGLLSDIWGRKPVIFIGLLIFIAGSLVAAFAETIQGLIFGRLLQGAGAIAGAVMAMVADLTPEDKRTKAMAIIGASIGVSFGIALALGPWIASMAGIRGVFLCTSVAAGIGIVVLIFVVPTAPKAENDQAGSHKESAPLNLWVTFKSEQLFRLNWGIFTLHAILMCAFVVVPGILELNLQVAREQHWLVYICILLGSFACMMPLITQMEKRDWVKQVFLFSVVGLSFSLAALALFIQLSIALLSWLMLFAFFVAFNLLEATLPSLVSKLAPKKTKGTALGIYSTSQFIGAFVGGSLGGAVSQAWGAEAALLICAIMGLIWLLVAAGMRVSPKPLPESPGLLP